jgi:DNA-directed RNA polymerase specialized sigma24 family protein
VVEQEEKKMFEPFAVEIYRRFLRGETIRQLAARLDIPADRVETRIRVAARYLGEQYKRAA